MARAQRTPPAVRLAWRIAGAIVVCLVLAFGSLEFAQRIGQNVALSRELARTNAELRALRARRDEQFREIARLHERSGLVPYIHRRLRMVEPGQTLVYVVPAPPQSR
ncbi:MAG: FtsB family cell division protein [Candidatus Tyrphobacter sp.]